MLKPTSSVYCYTKLKGIRVTSSVVTRDDVDPHRFVKVTKIPGQWPANKAIGSVFIDIYKNISVASQLVSA